jgi:HK97 family phage major capsid protein
VVLQAFAQAQQAKLPASGAVLNDLDLIAMQTVKNEQGDYIASGGPFGPPITTLWGRPVVGTPAITQGTFLVGAFRTAAQLFDRWDATVLISTENADDFVKNLCTILAEERVALAVKRPTAFIYGSLPVST